MGRRKKYNTEEERKEARREADKRYRERHKNEIAAYSAAYYQKNKTEILARQTAYKAAHKDKRKVYDATYRDAHKEEILAKQAEYNVTPFGRARYLAGNYRKADKKYNRGECTIDAQWVVDNVFSGQVCHYCGETDWHLLGCDRLDNTKPHTPENCVPCCNECNKKKYTTPYDEFMRRIGKIA